MGRPNRDIRLTADGANRPMETVWLDRRQTARRWKQLAGQNERCRKGRQEKTDAEKKEKTYADKMKKKKKKRDRRGNFENSRA